MPDAVVSLGVDTTKVYCLESTNGPEPHRHLCSRRRPGGNPSTSFALFRRELMADGRIAYLLKTPRRGRTHRVMSPMAFMARLAAVIPPPKIPLVRYHGAF